VDWFRRARQPEPAPPAPPRDRVVDPGDSPEALATLCAQTDAFVNRNAGRLPAAVVVDVRSLTDVLRAVVATTAVRPLDVHALISVRAVLEDYLPTTLTRYLAVDASLLDPARPRSPTPRDSLHEQVAALHASATTTLAAVKAQDVDALSTQGRFLRTKFTASDLDLS